MMLTLVEGGFFSLAKRTLTDRIKELTEKGIRSYLIVPEQQTVSAEREMAELLPPSAPLYFEVTNFTRLATPFSAPSADLRARLRIRRSRRL
jgi:ATP-dependent helicase/DNAse subunit B